MEDDMPGKAGSSGSLVDGREEIQELMLALAEQANRRRAGHSVRCGIAEG